MGWTGTIIAGAVGLGLIIVSAWRAEQPVNPLRPRMIPWRFLTLVGAAWVLVIVTHMVNLAGFETGPR
ncbi:hypothetical protein GC169_12305 [bacterium]|nr:hypothetical protein [bacterium]